jgi:hypothetical protein
MGLLWDLTLCILGKALHHVTALSRLCVMPVLLYLQARMQRRRSSRRLPWKAC